MVETRKTFHQDLDEVRRDIVRLAAHVTEFIPRGTDALLGNSLEDAQRLIDDDDLLDALNVQIEERCYQILALQAPVASDLRSVIVAIRLAYEMERSGDLMVNVCKGLRRIYPVEISPTVRGHIQTMSEQAVKLFKVAVEAYTEQNSALAAALDDMDDHLDNVHKQYIQTILSEQGDMDLDQGVQLALIGRYYERIGDHAVNIGEQVRYMVDGWLPEHAGAARAAARKPADDAHAPPADKP